ncbi:MAG TPA: DUF4259 domain-containing protein [Pseudonocardiaceae bacterium]
MGAWGTGPFDNDDAADFAVSLDHLEPEYRVGAIRATLTQAVEQTGYLERDAGGAAVAAAALVAAQHDDHVPIDCIHGPRQKIPELPDDLRQIAVHALVRVLGEYSELNELWIDSPDGEAWLHMVSSLTTALRTPVQQDI